MTKLDKKTHTYTDEKGPLSGVTSLLGDAGLIDFSMIPEAMRGHYMDRGSKVHRATQLLDEDDLDFNALDPVLKKYVEGYNKFRSDFHGRYKIISMEIIVRHPIQRYAGKIDRVCIIDGELAVLDIKSGVAQPWVALQTEGYKQAHNAENVDKIEARYALSLSKEGAYKLQKYTDLGDSAVWLSVVTLARWKGKIK